MYLPICIPIYVSLEYVCICLSNYNSLSINLSIYLYASLYLSINLTIHLCLCFFSSTHHPTPSSHPPPLLSTLSPFSCYTYIPEFANILTTLINMRLERRTGQILTPEATTGPHTYCSVTSYLSHIHTQHDCRHHTTQDLSHFPLKDPHKPLHFISTRAVWSQNG